MCWKISIYIFGKGGIDIYKKENLHKSNFQIQNSFQIMESSLLNGIIFIYLNN